MARDSAGAREIVAGLARLADPARAVREKRYLKSDLDFLGVSVPGTRRVVTTAVKRHPGLGREDVPALWTTTFEHRRAAVELLRLRTEELQEADLPLIERLIREAKTWALADELAAAIAGRIARRHPGAWPRIDGWAADEDFWIRRSALLALLPGIKAGQPDLVRLDGYACRMLTEREFFIRKAIGWTLRELSKKDPGFVTNWTRRHLAEMSGVTFREAVRHLPQADAHALAEERAIGSFLVLPPGIRSPDMWRKTGLVFAAGTTVIGLSMGVSFAADATATCGGSGSVTTATGTLPDGATFEIQCPAVAWNGTLFLYSHGYVVPGSPNPAQDAGDPLTASWLLGHGYALAGSSYSATGWAIQQAFTDQIGTLNTFDADYTTPSHTIAWGHSLGGIITAGLIQDFPSRFTAALPLCGVLAGGVATWNTALDAEFAFQQLIDPSVQVVNITSPSANLQNAEAAAAKAQQTPQGRARLALVSALGDTPGWFNPLAPEPAATDYAAQEAAQFQWGSQVTFPFVFDFRANLEQVAGGNPSWTTNVNYAAQLANSADIAEVKALYRAAGLNLGADLIKLQLAHQISADPAAVNYLRQFVSFNGQLAVPVLSVHTTGDGLVIPENEQAYRQVVDAAGDSGQLQQLFVHRAGHCTFTPAETITAIQVLLNRVRTGSWNVPSPDALNAEATALGPQYNVFFAAPTAPAYISYQPSLYPRPYDTRPPF